MTGQELVELLGLSVNDPKVTNVFEFFKIRKPKVSWMGMADAYDIKNRIQLEFCSKDWFEMNYLEQGHVLDLNFSNSDDSLATKAKNKEYFIQCIELSQPFIENLPFGLKADDTLDTIKKLGKLHRKENNKNYYIFYFLTEKYLIMVRLEKNKKLESINICLIDNDIRRALKRKATIKTQNKNLKPLTEKQIDLLKKEKPTALWRKRMLDLDEFTEENIQLSDLLLDRFLQALQLASTEKKANKVLSAIKAIVVGFNKLDSKYGHVCTLEREELCLFIDNAIKATGFEIEENDDLTLEWRQW